MTSYERALVLDLETAALPDAAAFLEEPSAPGNFKDPDKIAAYVREATQKSLDRCSMDPDLCRIVAVGWVLEDATQPTTILARDEQEEYDAICQFWDVALLPSGGVRRLVSYFGLSFDLPVLVRRSQYLGIEVPEISLDRYRTIHLDLHARLTFNGTTKTHALDFYAKRFALDVPHDDVDGSQIGALVRAGKWEQVRRHCEVDVLKTAALARRLGLLAPLPAAASEVA